MLFCPLPDLDMSLPLGDVDLQLARPLSAPAKHLSCEWFMSVETWTSEGTVRHGPESGPHSQPAPPHGNGVLKRFLKDIQRRLGGWVSTGGTTFIHKQLYIFHSPRHILDAQTALALYLSRTAENEDMMFRTLDHRSKQLLADEESHRTSSSHDTFGHLARVHALLTYQVLGLLDGDIHQRATAENRMETMMTWVDQMVESVRAVSACFLAQDEGDLSMLVDELGLGIKAMPTKGQTLLDLISQEDIVWHMWIFTESLRRTWIIVQGLNATYHALKNGWAVCPGSMRVTAGQGVWDAPSSFAWAQVLRETNIWFMEGIRTEILFTHAMPGDVDEFTKLCMEITFGLERMERWGIGGAVQPC